MLVFPLLLMVILYFQNMFGLRGVARISSSVYWGLGAFLLSTFFVKLNNSKLSFGDIFGFIPSKNPELTYFIFIIVTGAIYLLVYLVHNQFEIVDNFRLQLSEKLLCSVLTICYGLALLLIYSANWAMNHFKGISIDQIIYTLTQPLDGTDSSQIDSFIFGPVIGALVTLFITTALVYILVRISKSVNRFLIFRRIRYRKLFLTIISSVLLIAGFLISVNEIGYAEVKAYFFEKTKIYETNYVDPKQVKVTFPEQKRNLIYIFLESMESTYVSKDLGGAEKQNLLPNFSQMIENNQAINFSNTDKIGGALPIKTTSFTVGGMVAQTAGLPVKVSLGADSQTELGNEANDYGSEASTFLPGAYSIGEILAKEGYTNTLMLGSDVNFSGRGKYFTEHGNYRLLDYNTAKQQQWIPKDYFVWWGYEDEKLLENAKNVLTETASTGQPFNFTLLTADTHFEDGYMSASTPRLFKDQYANVIHFSDQMLAEFIAWIQQQPFYENTTIVISGDHLSMDQDFFDNIPSNYQRTVFNTIINSPIQPTNAKNRQFTTFDMYPTTLAALGATIEGNQLGFGVNLFSNQQTLPEKLGYKYFDQEISKRSTYYDEKLLKKQEALSSSTK